MKKAVVVVGSHHAGKSKTINAYLKPKLKIGEHEHKFILGGRNGFVLSQTLEERTGDCTKVAATVQKYSGYDFLVMAARPSSERVSCLNRLKSELKTKGYQVKVVDVTKGQPEQYYRDRADEIFNYLLK